MTRPPATESRAPSHEGVGHVVSDLHLLTRRSTAPAHMDAIHRAVALSDVFVLNGDIFDFKWSTHRGAAASVSAAVRWLRDFVASAPGCEFVYVVGNHDCIPPFLGALDELAGEFEGFRWEPFFFHATDKVFLHGDVVNGFVTPAALEAARERWTRAEQKGRVMHAIYSAVATARIHMVLPHLIPKRRCARRLVAYLRLVLGDAFAGLRHVYFGHTHRPFAGYRFDEIHFHNSGATVTGSRLRIVRFRTTP